jgi:hypothetical protein
MADLHLTLTPQQAQLIIHALQAVVSSGGGAYRLAYIIQNNLGLDLDWGVVSKMQQTIYQEIEEPMKEI